MFVHVLLPDQSIARALVKNCGSLIFKAMGVLKYSIPIKNGNAVLVCIHCPWNSASLFPPPVSRMGRYVRDISLSLRSGVAQSCFERKGLVEQRFGIMTGGGAPAWYVGLFRCDRGCYRYSYIGRLVAFPTLYCRESL